jgi:iron(III) transport system permease protein
LSRPLVLLALLVFALAGLAPVGAMAARVTAADLAHMAGPRTLSLFGRTLGLGLATAGLALVAGAPFGWLVARTNVAGRALLRPLGVVPLLLPPLMLAITFSALSELRGAPATELVLGASTFPIVALFVAHAAERVDGRLVDAALAAGGLRAVLRMELPLLLPAAASGACLAFVFAVNDFAVPDYVSAVGPKFNVYADEVFSRWQTDHQAGGAVAAALPLVALTLLALAPALLLRRRAAPSIPGDFRPPAVHDLGRLRWPLTAACALLVLATAVTPIARLAYEAGGGPRGFALDTLRAAFSRALELARGNIASSLGFATAAALVCVPLGLVLGHALERARRGAWLAGVAILPFAVPGILLGIGTIVTWNRPATAALYDSGWMVVVLFTGRYAVLAVFAASAAVAAIDRRLEEAAELAGARPAERLARIVAPAVRPALFGAWAAVFVLSMRELDAAILVPEANSVVMFRVYNAVHFGRDDFVAALCLLVIFFTVLPALLWSLFARRPLELLP